MLLAHNKKEQKVTKSTNLCTKKAQSNVKKEEKQEKIHNETENNVENPVVEQVSGQEETKIEENSSYTTRLTSYWAYDEYGTGDTTATGLSPVNFEINQNGWYTYQGKLVIATASNRLGTTSMRTYNLYDELTLNIDGVDYSAIVLDVCGACMRDSRIDLFVSGGWAVKDTTIMVKE